jgi:sensor histidine kinase YesM
MFAPTSRASLTALAVWVAWTALAVFFAITTSLTYISQGRPPLWGFSLVVALTQWWLWAVLTPLVGWASRAWPLERGRLRTTLVLHLAASLVVGVAKAVAENVIREGLLGVRPYLLINTIALQVLIYWAIVGVVLAVDQLSRDRARTAEAEARLGHAQVQLLRAQLQPHFLFNALNAIAELVHEDQDKADRMLGLLSDLLRATLDADDRPQVTLREELALTDRYLAIQQVRFGERLVVHRSIDQGCDDALVPHLCLQPLVENAVRHGLATRASGGTIRIAAERRRGALSITIEDDGAGLGPAMADGVGLAATRARLRALHGPMANLTLAPRPTGGTIATVVLPQQVGA